MLFRPIASLAFVLAVPTIPARGADITREQLGARFDGKIHGFLQTYCISCHGKEQPEADLDLTAYSSLSTVLKDGQRWSLVQERIAAEEMPPAKAKLHPSAQERAEAVDWFQALRADETRRNAGDPGVVLARRLTNAEYDYTIRDLTGVDLKPTREFPADPSNMAGFENSGESLVMSPALLKKYLGAAREVANTMFLKPEGFGFAPYPMLVETDRDKYCVQQIIDFYHRQNLDYADYFEAAWRFKYRAALGKPRATLAEIAADKKVSAKYLSTIWDLLETRPEEIGPAAKLQVLWRNLPTPVSGATNVVPRQGCEQMRQYVVQLRQKVEMRFLNITAGKVGAARQPLLIWKNVQYATHRRDFDPSQLQVAGEHPPPPEPPEPETTNPFGPGKTRLIVNASGDPDLQVPAGERARYEAAFGRFCRVFPDMFYKEERGRNYFDTSKDRGRYLSAGFHNVMGYFRDDQALYELILDDQQQRELDEMWREMDFVASTTTRMYVQFGSNRESLGNVAAGGETPENATIEDKSVTSEIRIRQLEAAYLDLAQGGGDVGIHAIEDYFSWINTTIRGVEKARLDAEPSHLQALLDFAAKAYRRPLTAKEKNDLLGFYRSARTRDGLDHETAMRESLVSILLSPNLCYRIDLLDAAAGVRPLSDYDLASRLSYFLWSSLPDAELLAHAARGDLHDPKVISAQARRMLHDPRARALALEFGGSWLDFRRFEQIGTVDTARFPEFTADLKQAMFEEPVRFLQDIFQSNRSVLDCLYARDTFVNPVLAKHYGMPVPAGGKDVWARVENADEYERGGLLPMAIFLTKNAPGLRTSPVKRGNWVVKNLLGERIPPPPPSVPELPKDEAKLDLPLRDMLARHRADPNCAACHARFDSFGLVFEDFGPVGERREKDLGGRPVDVRATFPNGVEASGLAGLRHYVQAKRQDDFVDNLCGKLLAYALGRSLLVSDNLTLQDMHRRLAANDYRFDTLIESIVTSRQFLNKRGRDDVAAQ